ncbi:MAG: hypothetical protein K2P88_11440 [Chitinophagaceae bacterium]|nr:hypothetical protein [Chitinophagaceae bacterium]
MAKSNSSPKWHWDTIANSPVLLLGAIYVMFTYTNTFINSKNWRPFISNSVLGTVCKIFVGILMLLILFFLVKMLVHAVTSGIRTALSKSIQPIFDWVANLLIVLTVGFGIYYGIVHAKYLFALTGVVSVLLFTSFIDHLKTLFFAK